MKNTQRIIPNCKKHKVFLYILSSFAFWENNATILNMIMYSNINLPNDTNKITSKIIRKLNFKTKTLTKIKN